MLTAVFSLAGALVFGAADFLGGLAAKRVSSVLVTAVAAATGFVLLAAAAPFLGGDWNRDDVFWGVVSGLAGAVAISLLYACLAIGPMSILSPLTAVVSAVVPMVWGLLVGGERFAPLGYWALGLALVAVVLVGFVPERGAVRPSLRGILMAIGSGVAIGTFFVTIDQTSEQSGVVPLLLNRGVTTVVMFAAVGVLALVAASRRARIRRPAVRARSRPPRRASGCRPRRPCARPSPRRARPPPRACGSRSRAAWSTSRRTACSSSASGRATCRWRPCSARCTPPARSCSPRSC